MTKQLLVAAHDSTGCNGCKLKFADLEEDLFALLRIAHLDEFRLIKSNGGTKHVDIAFWEGCITTEEALERLKDVRERSKKLIALGTCACTGGVSGGIDATVVRDAQRGTYGEGIKNLRTLQPMPIDNYVHVDFHLFGCPVRTADIVATFATIVTGGRLEEPTHPVCEDCRRLGVECIGTTQGCLGPITRGGACNASCPSAGRPCFGCRGMHPEANLPTMETILKRHGHTEATARKFIGIFNPFAFKEKEDSDATASD